MSKKIKVMSLFSGVGGLELGLPKSKFEVIGLSEIERSASEILAYHHKGIKNYGDISEIKTKDLPDFDMLVGGSPCQDLSSAGKRKGLFSGSKSSLFFQYIRILTEKKPKMFIWENVKGTFSSNKGHDFLAVQKSFIDAGYHIQWQLLNSEDFGIPQKRNRVFFVGAKDPKDLPGLLNIVDIVNHKNDSVKFSTFCGSMINDGILQTITRSYGKLSGNGTKVIENMESSEDSIDSIIKSGENKNIRIITPNEAELAMGWPKDHTKYGIKNGKKVEISYSDRYKACGNGIVSQCVTEMIKESKDLSFSLDLNLDFCSYSHKKDLDFNHMESIGLKENCDFILDGVKVYFISYKMLDYLLSLNKLIKIHNPKKGMLSLDFKHILKKEKKYKSKLRMFSSIKEKNPDKMLFLTLKDCKYLKSKIKK